jgi:hypothetical protein
VAANPARRYRVIVSVYDLGLEGQTYWIATELVVGEPLKNLIERGPLCVSRSLLDGG